MEENKTKTKKKKKFSLFKIFLIISLIFSISSLEIAFRHGEPTFMSYFYIPLILFKGVTIFSLFKAKEELARKISIIFLIACIFFSFGGMLLKPSFMGASDSDYVITRDEAQKFGGDFGESLASSFAFLNPIRDSYTAGNFFGLLAGFGVWIFYLTKEKPKKKKENKN
jgi:hypothetical protein